MLNGRSLAQHGGKLHDHTRQGRPYKLVAVRGQFLDTGKDSNHAGFVGAQQGAELGHFAPGSPPDLGFAVPQKAYKCGNEL